MNRRHFLATLPAAAAVPSLRAQGERPPNVLLILFDKCRVDAIGAHGGQGVSTPHLDALAREGTVFTHAFTPQALCGPARASMLTGKYPHEHRLRRNVYPVARGTGNSNYHESIADPFRDPRFNLWDNFAFYLNNSGYATGCVGKWHLGPGNPGFFDYFKGFNSLLRHWVGEPHKSRYRPDIHTEDAIRFIEQNARQPWFLYQSYYAPHEPLDPPKEFAAKFAGREHADYHATVSHLDHCVGRTVEALRRLSLLDNTLIVFTADHGRTWIDRPGSAEGIALPYDEVSRVPMIVRFPKLFPARKWRAGVTTADIMPTVLEATGVSAGQGPPDFGLSPTMQARSLAAEVRSGDDSWKRPVILQNIPQRGIDGSYFDERAIRTERHKLILRKFDVRPEVRPGELYDIAQDPEESKNLYRAGSAEVRALGAELAKWGRGNGDALSVELGEFASRA